MQKDKWRILMAEDDPEDRWIMQNAMDMINAVDLIHFAENGEDIIDTLEALSTEENQLSLIVLDLNMPRLNGTDTLRAIKNDPRFLNIPVIMFSTSANPTEKEKCLNLGAHSYINKPVNYKESLETAHIFKSFCRDVAG